MWSEWKQSHDWHIWPLLVPIIVSSDHIPTLMEADRPQRRQSRAADELSVLRHDVGRRGTEKNKEIEDAADGFILEAPTEEVVRRCGHAGNGYYD